LKQIVKKINFLKVAEVVATTLLVFAPLITIAAPWIPCDQNTQNCSGGNVQTLIKTVIDWMLAIAFGVAVLFLIVGGFWYVTSAGNEETAEKGKGTVINAIIGIVIIILSYVIINVVYRLVSNSNVNTGP